MLGVAEGRIRKGIVIVGSKMKVRFHFYTKGKAEMALKAVFSLSVLLGETSLWGPHKCFTRKEAQYRVLTCGLTLAAVSHTDWPLSSISHSLVSVSTKQELDQTA